MKKPKRSPSRIKYEQNNPTVSARLPVEVRKQLLANLKILGMSVADAFKVLAGDLEIKAKPIAEARKAGFEEAKNRYMVTCPCARCGKPIVITSPETKKVVSRFLTGRGWHHKECPKKPDSS